METLGVISLFLASVMTVLTLRKVHSFLNFLFLIPLLFGYVVVLIAFVVWFWELSPLKLNDIRSSYVNSRNLSIAYTTSLIYFFGAYLVFRFKSCSDFDFKVLPASNLYFFIVLAFISSYLVNGTHLAIYGGYGTEGFKTDRWGGWPLIFIYSCAKILSSEGRDKLRFRVLLLLVLYWFLAGNRSEILLLSVVLLKFKSLKSAGFRITRSVLPLVIVAFIFDLLGRIRSTGLSMRMLGKVLTESSLVADGALSISTIGSSYYTLIASIGLTEKYGFLLGKSYLAYLVNSVPSFVPVPWPRIDDIAWYTEEAGTIGGSLFFAEAYMNYGLIGVLVFSLLFHLFWSRIWEKANVDSLSLTYVFLLLIYFQRYFLYGFVYFWKSIILLGFLFLMRQLVKR